MSFSVITFIFMRRPTSKERQRIFSMTVRRLVVQKVHSQTVCPARVRPRVRENPWWAIQAQIPSFHMSRVCLCPFNADDVKIHRKIWRSVVRTAHHPVQLFFQDGARRTDGCAHGLQTSFTAGSNAMKAVNGMLIDLQLS
jgi:hypothetical protein